MKLILTFLICFIFVGCENPLVETIPIGKVLDCNVIPTAFNDVNKTQVKTEKVCVVIAGTPPIEIGAETFLSYYKKGNIRLFTDRNSNSYNVLNK